MYPRLVGLLCSARRAVSPSTLSLPRLCCHYGTFGREAVHEPVKTASKENACTPLLAPELGHVSLRSVDMVVGTSQPVNLLYTQLRDACKCPLCVDPHSQQRRFQLTDIPDTIRVDSVRYEDKKLHVEWKDDIPGYPASHTSTYHLDFLQNPHDYDADGKSILFETPYLRWGRKSMEKMQHWVSHHDFMNNETKFAVAMRHLSLYGLVFVKDIPKSREMVAQIAEKMGPLRNSFYGSTWDVRMVPEARNVAYTNVFLDFHQDLLYMHSPPGYQLLHCLENSCEGGESLFTDGFRAASILKAKNFNAYRTLMTHPLLYQYVQDGHLYRNHWAVIQETRRGKLLRVNYSPPFQGSLAANALIHHNTVAKVQRALALYRSILEHPSSYFELKLNPGECVIFNNRRILHARRQFDTSTGSRWLAGAYVDTEDVVSRFHTVRQKYNTVWNSYSEIEEGSDEDD